MAGRDPPHLTKAPRPRRPARPPRRPRPPARRSARAADRPAEGGGAAAPRGHAIRPRRGGMAPPPARVELTDDRDWRRGPSFTVEEGPPGFEPGTKEL